MTGSSWTTSPTRSWTGSRRTCAGSCWTPRPSTDFTAGLCDAVTGRTDGKAMLESLERQNLFVVPLDDQRRWYRYHHLFADVLRARLLDERPGDESGLHRRASDWYDQAGDPESAVRHALAAGDVALAADRVELAMPGLRRERREAVIRRWIDELPADIVRNRPVLAVGFIGGLAASNEFGGIGQRLRDVEQLLARPVDDSVVLDEGELVRLPAVVQTYHAALALVPATWPAPWSTRTARWPAPPTTTTSPPPPQRPSSGLRPGPAGTWPRHTTRTGSPRTACPARGTSPTSWPAPSR